MLIAFVALIALINGLLQYLVPSWVSKTLPGATLTLPTGYLHWHAWAKASTAGNLVVETDIE